MVRETLRQELKSLIRRYYENEAERDQSATSPAIPLNVPSFGWEEVWAIAWRLRSVGVPICNLGHGFWLTETMLETVDRHDVGEMLQAGDEVRSWGESGLPQVWERVGDATA